MKQLTTITVISYTGNASFLMSAKYLKLL